jgi:hypothetical protein
VKHAFFRLSLLAVFCLGACSLNTYNYLTPEKQREINERAQQTENKAIAIAARERCPKMIFGKLPRRPNTPAGEIAKIKPGDDAAIQAILLRYIDQLNEENRRLRGVIKEDRAHYLEKCLEFATDQVKNPE